MAIMNAFYRAIHNVARQSKKHQRELHSVQKSSNVSVASIRNTNSYLFVKETRDDGHSNSQDIDIRVKPTA